MKKYIVYLLCVILCLGAVTACTGKDENNGTNVTATPSTGDNGTGISGDTTGTGTNGTDVSDDKGGTNGTDVSGEVTVTPTEGADNPDNITGTPDNAGDSTITPTAEPQVTDTPEPAGEDEYAEYDAYGECYLGFYPYCAGTDQQDIHTDDADDKIIGYVSIPEVVYYGPVEKIREGIADMNTGFRDSGTYFYNEIKEMIPYMDEEELKYAEDYNYFYESEFYGIRSDKEIFSGIISSSIYTGGIHPESGYGAVNISGATGKELSVSDVFTDKEKLAEVLINELKEKYPDTLFFDLEETIKQEVDEERISFLIGCSGISFLFSPYEIASYADGLLTVSLPFNKYGDLIVDNVKKVPDVMNMKLTTYVPYYLDIDGDGDEDRMELSVSLKSEEYTAGDFKYYVYYADRLDVKVNDKKVLSYQFTEYSYDEEFFLMQNEDGEKYFYIKSACASEDYTVEGFKCGTGKFTDIGTVAENLQGSLEEVEGWAGSDVRMSYLTYVFNPYSIPVLETTDVIGTIQMRSNSHIDSDGNFIPWSVKSEFIVNRPLTTLQDVTCVKSDESGAFLEEDVVLPAGIELNPIWTAGNTGVLFEDWKNNEYFYVDFTFKDYQYFVNEKPTEEVFDGIFYAD